MFDIANWTDPAAFWLNLTNLGLGILTLCLLLAVGGSFLRELIFGHEYPLREETSHPSRLILRATANHRLFRIVLKKQRHPWRHSDF